jgi:hypothetical protein
MAGGCSFNKCVCTLREIRLNRDTGHFFSFQFFFITLAYFFFRSVCTTFLSSLEFDPFPQRDYPSPWRVDFY